MDKNNELTPDSKLLLEAFSKDSVLYLHKEEGVLSRSEAVLMPPEQFEYADEYVVEDVPTRPFIIPSVSNALDLTGSMMSPEQTKVYHSAWTGTRSSAAITTSNYNPDIGSDYTAISNTVIKMTDINDMYKYSCKCYNILRLVKKTSGRIIIYSRFVTHGIVPLVLAVEKLLGYNRYDSMTNLLGRGRYPAVTDEDGYLNNYAIIAGAASVTTNQSVAKARNAASTTDMDDHHRCKLFIVTAPGITGLDYKGVRTFHSMDSWFHYGMAFVQAAGRMIRSGSHTMYPEEKRSSAIYYHVAVPNLGKNMDVNLGASVDNKIHIEADKRMGQIVSVDNFIKKYAMVFYFTKPAKPVLKNKKKGVVVPEEPPREYLNVYDSKKYDEHDPAYGKWDTTPFISATEHLRVDKRPAAEATTISLEKLVLANLEYVQIINLFKRMIDQSGGFVRVRDLLNLTDRNDARATNMMYMAINILLDTDTTYTMGEYGDASATFESDSPRERYGGDETVIMHTPTSRMDVLSLVSNTGGEKPQISHIRDIKKLINVTGEIKRVEARVVIEQDVSDETASGDTNIAKPAHESELGSIYTTLADTYAADAWMISTILEMELDPVALWEQVIIMKRTSFEDIVRHFDWDLILEKLPDGQAFIDALDAMPNVKLDASTKTIAELYVNDSTPYLYTLSTETQSYSRQDLPPINTPAYAMYADREADPEKHAMIPLITYKKRTKVSGMDDFKRTMMTYRTNRTVKDVNIKPITAEGAATATLNVVSCTESSDSTVNLMLLHLIELYGVIKHGIRWIVSLAEGIPYTRNRTIWYNGFIVTKKELPVAVFARVGEIPDLPESIISLLRIASSGQKQVVKRIDITDATGEARNYTAKDIFFCRTLQYMMFHIFHATGYKLFNDIYSMQPTRIIN